MLYIFFGNVLGVDSEGLVFIVGVVSVSVLGIVVFYCGLLLESFDFLYMVVGGGCSGGVIY